MEGGRFWDSSNLWLAGAPWEDGSHSTPPEILVASLYLRELSSFSMVVKKSLNSHKFAGALDKLPHAGDNILVI